MSIQREEITIKEFTSGTTLIFFSTHLAYNTEILERNPVIEYAPSIITLNNFNIPIEISTFDGLNLWKLDPNNIYQPLTSTSTNFVTGHSYVQDVNQILESGTINRIENEFKQSIYDSIGTAVTTSPTSYVFSAYNEIDDFYVDIKLQRTFGTLDTLNIYNNFINSMPVQEAKTGVVFGKLMALQTIRDPEGNRIRIPLRNVPVGLFNPSEDFPTTSSFSDDGDRIFLNVKESAEQQDYFNVESFNLDKKTLLRSASKFTSVPDQYKYITTTNDEGEFVIYDAPLGSQIVMFEVDLMKQGLTRDEIALNFFPFPPDEDAVIDQIPNFSFKQFPIEVVPAWGTIQTGYTELNVTVNMDLRKWTTYLIPPVSVGGNKLEAAVASSAANSLKIGIRNMAKEGYPKTQIKMTSIPNDLDKVNNQLLNWHQEFTQVKDEADFFKHGISIIKLPANIYDPNAFRTDKDGVPMPNQKGVWLSAYQLKIFSNSNKGVSRMSGTYHQDSSHAYSHYNLTHTNDNILAQDESSESLNKFPYEKPWSTEYPNQYSIPSKPTQSRFISDKTNGRTETAPGNGLYFLNEPSFSDGDMIGNLVDSQTTTAGGFGMQPAFNIWIPNRVAHAITKNYMYKYESGVAINESYSNGFEPSNPNFQTGGFTNFIGTSSVVGGEKYQRLECGYGYFCRPDGWPRVARYPWGGGEALFKPDVTHGQGLGGSTTTPGPGTTGFLYSDGLWSGPSHRNDIYNIQTQDPALALDRANGLKNAGVDFFRVIDPSSDNLTPIEPFVIPTYSLLNTSAGSAERINAGGWFSIKNRGEINVNIPYFLNPTGLGYPVWTPTQGYHTGTSLLKPGEILYIFGNSPASHAPVNLRLALQYTAVKLPGNSNFNINTNRYDISFYEIGVVYSSPIYQSGPSLRTVAIGMAAGITAPSYYLKTQHSGGGAGLSSLGINCTTVSNANTSNPFGFGVAGMVIENNTTLLHS